MDIDNWLFQLINQTWQNSAFDVFFPAITDLHKTVWFLPIVSAIIVFFLVRKYQKKGLLYFFMLIVCIGVSDLSGAQVKRMANRPRPFQVSELHTLQRSPASENTSFYSNHASNNFAFATFMTLMMPAGSLIYFLIATLIAYSRIYNGVHFPSDVFVGAIAGTLWGFIFYYAATYLSKYIAAFSPKSSKEKDLKQT